MLLGPVVERELRHALHANRGTKSRFRVAVIGAVAAVAFMLFFFVTGSAGWGSNLHHVFFLAGLYLAIGPAMRISVGLFSEERRNQTLELLFLTGMNSGELFLEKLLGGILVASADLLALAPLMAMPFLIGGISLDLYLATLACLPALLFFVVAVGTLSSVIFTDDGLALIFMAALAGCICLATPIPHFLGAALTGTAPFSAKWLCTSPAYAPYLVVSNFAGAGPREFWLTILSIIAWSTLCLGLAWFLLGRNWQTEIIGAKRARRPGGVQTWAQGGQSWRDLLRQRLLPANPYRWLTEQDRRPLLTGYGSIGLICVLWLIGWRTWPGAWLSNENFFITALVLIAMVNWLKLFTAARRIGTDRRDGILELLLTTPLTPEEMVEGEVAALTASFRPLKLTVLAICLLMMAAGFAIRSWNTFAVVTYVAIWCVLCVACLKDFRVSVLRVMWAAVNTGRPVYSVFRWSGSKWTWIWLLYNFRNLARSGFTAGASGFPTGSGGEFALVCTIGVPAAAFYFIWQGAEPEVERDLRRRLTSEMRLIATEPLPDPNDPAFKKWDGVRRLQYRSTNLSPGGWPGFVDPPEAAPLNRPGLDAPGGTTSPTAIGPLDALEFFRRLRARSLDYLVVGGLAMNSHLGDRNTLDADVVMSADALKGDPELHVQERTDHFVCARFRGIRVVVYSTANPFFDALRARFAITIRISETEIPAASVGGLLALNLYATYLVSVQREYYRSERYEVNIIALLTRHPCSFEPILDFLRAYVPEQHMEELSDTLDSCAKYAEKARRRLRKNATEAAPVSGAPV